VLTGYLPEEWDSVLSAAEFLEMPVEEFQLTGVYVVDFLTQLGVGGYGAVEPLVDPPDPFGPEEVVTVWGVEDREVQELTNFFERTVVAYQVGVEGDVAFDEDF